MSENVLLTAEEVGVLVALLEDMRKHRVILKSDSLPADLDAYLSQHADTLPADEVAIGAAVSKKVRKMPVAILEKIVTGKVGFRRVKGEPPRLSLE